MGKKYIIEIEDDRNIIRNCGKTMLAVSIAIGKTAGSINTGIELTPYTAPDLEQVRKEAHDKCMDEAEMLAYKLYSPKIDEAYQKGLSDAWETAKKIIGMSWELKKFIFGDYHLLSNIFADFGPSEAMMKLKVTENGKNPIRFGDEVTFNDGEKAFFVVEDDEHKTGGFVSTDGTFVERDMKDVRGKTGDSLLSHLDTIINILCEGKI